MPIAPQIDHSATGDARRHQTPSRLLSLHPFRPTIGFASFRFSYRPQGAGHRIARAAVLCALAAAIHVLADSNAADPATPDQILVGYARSELRTLNNVRPLSTAEDGQTVGQLNGVYGAVLSDELSAITDPQAQEAVVLRINQPRRSRIEVHVQQGRIAMILLFATKAQARHLSKAQRGAGNVVACANAGRSRSRLVGFPTSRIRGWEPRSPLCAKITLD